MTDPRRRSQRKPAIEAKRALEAMRGRPFSPGQAYIGWVSDEPGYEGNFYIKLIDLPAEKARNLVRKLNYEPRK
jgi:hypothetical protein